MNLGTIWGRFVEKTGAQKSRATVPFRQLQFMSAYTVHVRHISLSLTLCSNSFFLPWWDFSTSFDPPWTICFFFSLVLFLLLGVTLLFLSWWAFPASLFPHLINHLSPFLHDCFNGFSSHVDFSTSSISAPYSSPPFPIYVYLPSLFFMLVSLNIFRPLILYPFLFDCLLHRFSFSSCLYEHPFISFWAFSTL